MLKKSIWIGSPKQLAYSLVVSILTGGGWVVLHTALAPASLLSVLPSVWASCLDLLRGLFSVPGLLDFSPGLPSLRRWSQDISQLGSGPTWMSQAPSSSSQEDDEISLAVVFQGLKVSVVGPASKALDFIHKLVPDQQGQSSSSQRSSPDHSACSASTVIPSPVPPCPDRVLALASRLSAASILSPKERIQRAWICGIHARALLDSKPVPIETVVAIDLPDPPSQLLCGAQGKRH